MKNLFFFSIYLFLSIPNTLFGQYNIYSVLNNTTYSNRNLTHMGKLSIGINADLSSAPLTVYKPQYAYFELVDNLGKLQIAKAVNYGDFAPSSVPGATIFRNLNGSHNMIFNMPNDNNDGSTKIKINDLVNHNTFVVFNNGKIGMGTQNFDYENYNLYVKNGIKTEKIKVEIATNNGWADYVFNDSYNLMPLTELEKFIKQNKHLPEVPGECEAIENGIELKEMNILLLKKVEELTLHIIELDKRIKQLEQK